MYGIDNHKVKLINYFVRFAGASIIFWSKCNLDQSLLLPYFSFGRIINGGRETKMIIVLNPPLFYDSIKYMKDRYYVCCQSLGMTQLSISPKS